MGQKHYTNLLNREKSIYTIDIKINYKVGKIIFFILSCVTSPSSLGIRTLVKISENNGVGGKLKRGGVDLPYNLDKLTIFGYGLV